MTVNAYGVMVGYRAVGGELFHRIDTVARYREIELTDPGGIGLIAMGIHLLGNDIIVQSLGENLESCPWEPCSVEGFSSTEVEHRATVDAHMLRVILADVRHIDSLA